MGKNEVAVKEEYGVAEITDNDFMQAMQPEQDITAQDVMIPKILIMQPQSPRVVEQDNKLGDLVDTMNWEKLANAKDKKNDASSLEVVPFFWTKYWLIKKQNGSRWDFESMIKMDRTNQNEDPFKTWPGDDGVLRKREYMHLFYVLVPGKQIPYALAFKGASKKAGDSLVTQMFTVNKNLKVDAAWKASPMAKAMHITPVITSKNDNTFVTLEVSVSRDSTFDEAVEALTWSKAVSSGATKTDHSDLASEEYIDAHGGEF